MEKQYENKVLTDIREMEDTAYFWFDPVKFDLEDKDGISEDQAQSLGDRIYVHEEDVFEFLDPFLRKYFEPDLEYNLNRYNVKIFNEKSEFDWYGHSYYTYDSMKKICSDILNTSKLFKDDYYNPILDDLKGRVQMWNLLPKDDPYYKADESDELIKRHIDVVVDFYERFVEHIFKIMEQHPETSIIGIYGV